MKKDESKDDPKMARQTSKPPPPTRQDSSDTEIDSEDEKPKKGKPKPKEKAKEKAKEKVKANDERFELVVEHHRKTRVFDIKYFDKIFLLICIISAVVLLLVCAYS